MEKKIWHNYDEPTDPKKEVLVEWDGLGETYHDVGYFNKEVNAVRVAGGAYIFLGKGDRWAYIEDLVKATLTDF